LEIGLCELPKFGIRTIKWSGKGLFINGKNTLLRGTCIHHDNGVIGARCLHDHMDSYESTNNHIAHPLHTYLSHHMLPAFPWKLDYESGVEKDFLSMERIRFFEVPAFTMIMV